MALATQHTFQKSYRDISSSRLSSRSSRYQICLSPPPPTKSLCRPKVHTSTTKLRSQQQSGREIVHPSAVIIFLSVARNSSARRTKFSSTMDYKGVSSSSLSSRSSLNELCRSPPTSSSVTRRRNRLETLDYSPFGLDDKIIRSSHHSKPFLPTSQWPATAQHISMILNHYKFKPQLTSLTRKRRRRRPNWETWSPLKWDAWRILILLMLLRQVSFKMAE